MPAKAGRQHRSRRNPVTRRMHVTITDDVLRRSERAADDLGVSLGVYLEELMSRVELDTTGRPVWADEFYAGRPEFIDPRSRATSADETLELPLTA